MKSSVKTNKEKFKSSSINFVKPIIPFPSIVDMMSKSQEFIPSPIDPNIVVEDVKVSVNIESKRFIYLFWIFRTLKLVKLFSNLLR